ncbi:hypothetical protein GW17_00052966 [Ensete ventricosum]|nr:hypothetical protein GW17_00052966 [Ensete ventricosum]RZS12731.1 hypothetical protein BHM03_00044222 [Ensete ventricosum]
MFGRENPPHRPSPFSFLPLRALSVHPCFPAAFSPRRPQPSFPPATMAPKKRASASSSSSSSSSSSRRNNQSQQPSQPSKFGIQHFFERHSQSQTAASSSFPNPPDPIPDRNLNPPQPEPAAADKPPPPDAPSEGGQSSSWQISPEVSKSVTNKRVRFSPGMLICQSQDDGGDVVTWKISPVNERLQSLSSKQLPRMMRISREAPRPQESTLRPCSLKQVLPRGSTCV